MPQLFETYSLRYGLFGVTLALVGWLLCISVIVVAATVVAAQFDRDDDPWARLRASSGCRHGVRIDQDGARATATTIRSGSRPRRSDADAGRGLLHGQPRQPEIPHRLLVALVQEHQALDEPLGVRIASRRRGSACS